MCMFACLGEEALLQSLRVYAMFLVLLSAFCADHQLPGKYRGHDSRAAVGACGVFKYS